MTSLRCLSIPFIFSAVMFCAEPSFQKSVSEGRNLSADDAAKLETALQSDPENADERAQLLGYYFGQEMGPNRESATAAHASRLGHVEWLIEHHPESDLAGIPQTFAWGGPGRVDSSDYDQLQALWRKQVERFPQDPRVLKNAADFLATRDNGAALELLRQALALQPQDRALGQRLGTLLGMAAMNVRGIDNGLAGKVRDDLRNCTNATVCGTAGTFISDMAMNRRGSPSFRQEDADLASKLLSIAQSLEPGNSQWSQALNRLNGTAVGFPRGSVGVLGGVVGSISSPATTPAVPNSIRVGGNVQSANLIRQVPPEYPALAKQARLQGTVRFNATIGKDGTIENLTLVSGHPLLVQAAQEAVKQWVYKPTLLNGQPVNVITTIDVSFTLNGAE